MASQGSPGRQGGQEGSFRPAFNQEELRVLRECNRESFYFRSLPLAAAFSGASYLLMKKGILKTSARFKYAPKIFLSSALGYFIGKISYQDRCAEKLMGLPDSPIGEALRKRKNRLSYYNSTAEGTGVGTQDYGGGYGGREFDERITSEPGFSTTTTTAGQMSNQVVASDDPRQEIDLTEGLDEYQRVTESLSPYIDSSSSSSSSIPPSTSYQELRRQNREEYLQRMAEKYRRPDHTTTTAPPPSSSPPPPYSSSSSYSSFPSSSSSSSSSSSVRKNQYGDDVYE